MKRLLLFGAGVVLASALLLWGTGAAVALTMPPYRDSIGDENLTEKVTGQYLVAQAAAREDSLIIFGSSELRTKEISTHPANFFAGKRAGFQVDLVGRGSCQSIIHAIQIASSGGSLKGKKVVLITSPQSYVPEGIAPDLFMANFSAQQYLDLLRDPDLTDELKAQISARVAELLEEYKATGDASAVDPAILALARRNAQPTALSGAASLLMTPYYAFSSWALDVRDMASVRSILEEGFDVTAPAKTAPIDWEAEEEAAVAQAEAMTAGNDFGMEDDYYTTYIGSRLARQEGSQSQLSYSESEEYGDLRLLLEVCRQKGLEPLFIHVPLHGQWSDYTGFTADRREEYYGNVRAIVREYGVQMLDLTGHEYEEYFMCDTMHLGWKGWLAVDRALIDYYYAG